MMARTKRSRRSYGAGEWGRNRVRVFPDAKTGLYQIEWRENGRRLTRSLGHRDWVWAKRQADEFAAGFVAPDLNGKAEAEPEPLTLEKLFEIYGEEVTPTKAETSQRSDRAATRMFLRFFGRGRSPETLSQRDWDRFIRARRSGKVGPSGRPVSNRTIEHDLKFLIAVLNWAAKSRDERGEFLLAPNPLRGLRTPTEKNPTRVVLSEEEYQTLLGVSREVDWRFHVALVLAHETGQQIVDGVNHGKKPLSSTGTARSALLVVGGYPAASCRNSGKTGLIGGSSAAAESTSPAAPKSVLVLALGDHELDLMLVRPRWPPSGPRSLPVSTSMGRITAPSLRPQWWREADISRLPLS